MTSNPPVSLTFHMSYRELTTVPALQVPSPFVIHANGEGILTVDIPFSKQREKNETVGRNPSCLLTEGHDRDEPSSSGKRKVLLPHRGGIGTYVATGKDA